MSISSTNRKAGPFTGNGTASSFPFYFKVFEAADLQVVLLDIATSLETTLTITANYTVSLNANQDAIPGGTVTLTAGALASGYKLTITSNIGNLQPTNLTNQGGFYPDVVEDALDRATIQIQQMSETLGRAVTIPISSTASTALPYPQGGTVIGWDDTGSSLVNLSPEDIASQQLYANWKYDTFTGDGTTTQFTLQSNPGNIANMDVSVSGVTQLPGTDYTLSGTTIAFTTAPALGLSILVRYGQATVQTNVTYSQEVFNVTSGTVDGTGKQTIFNLASSYSPGNNGISVYLNGSRLVGGTDYTETTTTRITLSKGAYPGDVVLIITAEPINANAVDSAQISYTPAGTNAVATNVQAKLRESVSAFDFMTAGEISAVQANTGALNVTTAVQNALTYAKNNNKNLYLPAGTYLVETTLVLDSGITVYGDGLSSTTIKRTSLTADVIHGENVYAVFLTQGGWNHIRDLQITGVEGSTTGVVTGIQLSLTNTLYISAKGSIKNVAINFMYEGLAEKGGVFLYEFNNVQAVSCGYGFRFNSANQKTSLTFTDCYAANTGPAYWMVQVNYSVMNSCAADNCNWGTAAGNPYGTGYGQRDDSKGTYHFLQSDMVLNSIGSEGSYGNGIVSLESSKITINNIFSYGNMSTYVPNYAAYPNYAVGPIQCGTAANSLVLNNANIFVWTNTAVSTGYPTKPIADLLAFNFDEATFGSQAYTQAIVGNNPTSSPTVKGMGPAKYVASHYGTYIAPTFGGPLICNGNISNGSYDVVTKVVKLAGTGTKITIPVTAQGTQNYKHMIKLHGIDGAFNTSSALPFEATFAFGGTTSPLTVTSTGLWNVTSVAAAGAGSAIEVTISASRTTPFIRMEIISELPSLIQTGSITIA